VTRATPEALVLILAGLLAAAAAAFVLTPLAFGIGARSGAVDRPAPHRHRYHPVPRTGGLALAVAFVLVGVLAVVFGDATASVRRLDVELPILVVLFGGVLLAAFLGFVDDRHDVRPGWQLLGQAVLAAVAVAAGLRIPSIKNPFGAGDIAFAEVFAVGFAALWIIALINSINFVDGLDGLSAGVALIASATLGVISLTPQIDQPFVALLCAVLTGALLGYLPWNFYPARVFIGTTGVWVVGYALGVLSILGTAKVAVALLVLGVPIIDTFWTIVRRLAEGRSPFSPDKRHLHHRLLDLGLTHRTAVLLVYGLCTTLAVLAFMLSAADEIYAFLGVVVAGGLVLALLNRRARQALKAESYEETTSGGG
jgi:UDP-GlcNAc:undecaprenyl-phosphate GlcNAc-1-phosphate transferase